MTVNGIKYINEALDYANRRLEEHEGPLDQELNDLIYGISLVYKDLRVLRPQIDEKKPEIRRQVSTLTQKSTLPIPKVKQIASREVESPPRKRLCMVPEHTTQRKFTRKALESRLANHDGTRSRRLPQHSDSGKKQVTREETAPRTQSPLLEGRKGKFTRSALEPHLTSYDRTQSRRSARLAAQSAPALKHTMRGIPNYGTNCFASSAYQLVKNNPPLYQEVFGNETFKADKDFDELRRFDEKYSSSKTLLGADMQTVRTKTLARFAIPSRGHQDPNEVFTRALFKHVPVDSPLYSRVVSYRTVEFTVPKGAVETALAGMENYKILSQEDVSGNNVRVRIQHIVRSDPQISLNLSLTGIKEGSTFQEVLVRDFSETVSDVYRLESGIPTKELYRDFKVIAPDNVMVTLKRFDGFNRKVNTSVDFQNGRIQLDDKGLHEVKGFIVHQGTSVHYGHCVEYQKIGSQWFLNNDSRSIPISERDALVAMRQAYVVYAERV